MNVLNFEDIHKCGSIFLSLVKQTVIYNQLSPITQTVTISLGHPAEWESVGGQRWAPAESVMVRGWSAGDVQVVLGGHKRARQASLLLLPDTSHCLLCSSMFLRCSLSLSCWPLPGPRRDYFSFRAPRRGL